MCSGIESQQSLVSALCKFVGAVKNMDEAVMIPSKLRDMEVGETDLAILEPNNNKSDLPKMPTGADLYSFYSMLNTVKHEIISGSASRLDTSSEMDDNANDSSKETADAFRHHLKGIFKLLHQLTETAEFLKSRYEGEVKPNTETSRPLHL
ncbi:hypothetical protein LOTGIDRAFT_113945 [Lottia gigantea]|uniref:Mid1-interacting protein 1 n=1 Tax=Lottia gigantea TaxID=225164 RepID=V4CAM5_LOTGI|nr:hypothetical protein LOTGIDRAFT_113945 [Lottia gigantea]ESO98854.1 hypothetical protein LOTGIDRAFT_113945 [Lottia gigantea]